MIIPSVDLRINKMEVIINIYHGTEQFDKAFGPPGNKMRSPWVDAQADLIGFLPEPGLDKKVSTYYLFKRVSYKKHTLLANSN
jgi:hypothetical protein